VLVVDQSQVFQRNLVLLSSLPLFGSLIALLRSAPEVNNLGLLNLNHWLEAFVEGFENLVFALVHVTQLFHDLRKNVFVRKNAPLRYFDFLRVSHDGLVELLNPSEDSVYLEGESPSLGLSIVFFEHVDVLSAQILPVSDGFFDPLGFGDLLPEDLKESRLATPDVAFDGEAVVLRWELRVEAAVFKILIQTSR
jgi:hypothetical protein